MKNLLPIFLVFILQLPLQAQDATVLNTGNRFGFFAAAGSERGPIYGQRNPALTGGGGLIFGDLFIGAYGQLGLDFDQLFENNVVNTLDLSHAGLWLGYTPGQHHLLHPIFTLRSGLGVVAADPNQIADFWDDYLNWGNNGVLDNVHVFHPEAGLELNIASFMRLHGSLGYRRVRGVNTPGLNNADFSGWTGALTLRLGWFGYDCRHRRRCCR